MKKLVVLMILIILFTSCSKILVVLSVKDVIGLAIVGVCITILVIWGIIAFLFKILSKK